MADATLNLILELKDHASKGLDAAAGKTSFLGDALKFAAGGAILSGITKVTGAVTDFLSGGIADARAANLMFAQTENVIKSTGGAAGFSAKQIADMAGSLSAAAGKSLFGDDDILRGTNMLLTFTEIKSTLPDATKIMLDMAQATGGDMQGAALQLGKALNNPIAGISALTRVGVTFTDQQKEQIKAMQESGDMAGAQSVILQELQKEFGGSAAAAAAADGGMAQFRDTMGEIGESIGQQALPLIGQFVAVLNNPAFVAGVQAVADALITGLGTAMTFLTDTAIPALITGWNTIQPALATVGAFVTETLMPAFQTFVGFVTTNIQPILIGLGTALVAIVVPAFVAWAVSAAAAATATIVALAPVLIPIAAIGLAAAALKLAWDSNFFGIRDTLTAFWTNTGEPIFTAFKTWLSVNIPVAIQALTDVWNNTLLPALKVVWAFIQDSVVPLLTSLADVVIAALKLAITALAGLWENVLLPAITAVWAFFQDKIVPILTTVGTTISTVLSPVIAAIASAFDTWYTAIGGVSGAISTVIGWFDKLAGAIGRIKLPAWLTPGSPTPLEQGLWGIADAARTAAGEMSPLLAGTGAVPIGMTAEQLAQQQALLATFQELWVSTFQAMDLATTTAMLHAEAIAKGAAANIVQFVNQAILRIEELISRIGGIPDIHVDTGPSQHNPNFPNPGQSAPPGGSRDGGPSSTSYNITVHAAHGASGRSLAQELYEELRGLHDQDNRMRSVR